MKRKLLVKAGLDRVNLLLPAQLFHFDKCLACQPHFLIAQPPNVNILIQLLGLIPFKLDSLPLMLSSKQ